MIFSLTCDGFGCSSHSEMPIANCLIERVVEMKRVIFAVVLMFGASFAFAGEFPEVKLYKNKITLATITSVERYHMDEHGIIDVDLKIDRKVADGSWSADVIIKTGDKSFVRPMRMAVNGVGRSDKTDALRLHWYSVDVPEDEVEGQGVIEEQDLVGLKVQIVPVCMVGTSEHLCSSQSM